MTVKSQVRFVAANLLSEINDALDDLREGVVPEVSKDAHDFINGLGIQADALIQQAQLRVLDVKARLTDQ